MRFRELIKFLVKHRLFWILFTNILATFASWTTSREKEILWITFNIQVVTRYVSKTHKECFMKGCLIVWLKRIASPVIFWNTHKESFLPIYVILKIFLNNQQIQIFAQITSSRRASWTRTTALLAHLKCPASLVGPLIARSERFWGRDHCQSWLAGVLECLLFLSLLPPSSITQFFYDFCILNI